MGNHIALAHFVADSQGHHHLVVGLRLANTVDGGHGGHNHHVAPLQDALGTTQAHLLDVFVDGAVFFNEQIALGHVRFGLVIVVVADEVFHSVLGEKFAELAVQLRCQRLVRRKYDGRPAQPGDHVSHGEGFARARHAQQGLIDLPVVHAFHQFVDGLRLIASGWIRLV